ncbi:hypothetical protein KEH51_04760 [[Brevibacterium] frigoritolerans]|uniref:Uncharacterized protein n=1 Tax=Peribacillus frigoritolerans TaxID=450367 RepID=A0A941J252_9BACI|nr:hypothetical protein [Peribacillus frigoritolerans]
MIVIKTDYFTSFYDKTLKKGNKNITYLKTIVCLIFHSFYKNTSACNYHNALLNFTLTAVNVILYTWHDELHSYFFLNDDRFKGPVAAKKRPLSPINPFMFPVIKLKISGKSDMYKEKALHISWQSLKDLIS